MIRGEPVGDREVHVGESRPADQIEHGRSGVRALCVDSRDGQCDQARRRILPVLGYDERPAIRGVLAGLSAVGAGVQKRLAGLGPWRDPDGVAPARHQQHEGAGKQGDDDEPDDAGRRQSAHLYVRSRHGSTSLMGRLAGYDERRNSQLPGR